MEFILPDTERDKLLPEIEKLLQYSLEDVYTSVGSEENVLKSIGGLFWNLLTTIGILIQELLNVLRRFIKSISKLIFRDKHRIDNNMKIFKSLSTNRLATDSIADTEVVNIPQYAEFSRYLVSIQDAYSSVMSLGNIHNLRSHVSILSGLSSENNGIDIHDTPYPITQINVFSESPNVESKLSTIGINLENMEYFANTDIVKKVGISKKDVVTKQGSVVLGISGYTISNIQELYTNFIKKFIVYDYDINEIESLISSLQKTIDKVLKRKAYLEVSDVAAANPRHKINRMNYLSFNLIAYSNIFMCMGFKIEECMSMYNNILTSIIIKNRV